MEPYVLGHSARERDRLDQQGRLYRGATLRALKDAGIVEGMRVLDVGCGSGDVTRLVSDLVGPTGSVYGIDRDKATIADAEARSAGAKHANVSFGVAELGGSLEADPFHALVGRFVLMHQPDPVGALRQTLDILQADGIVVFVESNMLSLMEGQHSHPKSEVYDELVRWKCRVVAAAGADIVAGFRLRHVFQKAGLPEPAMRVEAPILGGTETDYYRYMEESVRSMLPQALSFGIMDFDEERVGNIARDLQHDVVQHDGALVAWPVVAAWCRTQ